MGNGLKLILGLLAVAATFFGVMAILRYLDERRGNDYIEVYNDDMDEELFA